MNPKIQWQPWSKEAFQTAESLDKPILLDISATWCHWCHVMDQTTYSNHEIAALIMKNCVPIKVDRDQRPDIDKRYNMGGWPTTAFLTPNGKIITGGTYIPPQQMKKLIRQVLDYYKKNKQRIEAEAEESERKQTEATFHAQSIAEEDFQSVIDNIAHVVSESFDQTHGGFGFAPKFPQSEALAFALLEYRLKNHKALLDIVTKTLTHMQEGGIFDKVEGGFFRYSTTRDWSIPHYEKMCEDNAKLLANYLQAYQATGEDAFKATAQKTLNYIDKNLSDRANGGFYNSQDADEEYYKLSHIERQRKSKPRVDQTLYTNYNALMISSYLLASVVLKNPAYEGLAVKTATLFFEKGFKTQEGMCHFIYDGEPHLSTLLTDQVHMLKALVDIYQSTQERTFLHNAEAIADLALENLWGDKDGFLDRPAKTEELGMLKNPYSPFDENAVAADALLRLYYLTGNETYWEKAETTLRRLFTLYQNFELLASSYTLAVEVYLHPVQVQIVGSRKDSLTRQFVQQTLGVYNPLRTVEVLDPDVDRRRLNTLKYPIGERTTAYVCAGGKCTLAENAADLVKLVCQV